jgi:hypothetical protein
MDSTYWSKDLLIDSNLEEFNSSNLERTNSKADSEGENSSVQDF